MRAATFVEIDYNLEPVEQNVLLDGFDLGVGMLFGLSNSEANRSTMQNTVAPVWDGNETWLIVDLVGRVSGRLFDPVIRLLYPRGYHVAGADPAGRGVRISPQDPADALGMGYFLCRRFFRRELHAGRNGWRPGARAALH